MLVRRQGAGAVDVTILCRDIAPFSSRARAGGGADRARPSGVAAGALASFGVIAAVAVVLLKKRRLSSAEIVAAPRSVLTITA